jgi:hypothetical protein
MRGKKQYAWLEKYAEQQQKKKPVVPKTPEKLKKEAKVLQGMRRTSVTWLLQELEEHGANNAAKIRTPVPTIPTVNKPIADLLFEVMLLIWLWEHPRQYPDMMRKLSKSKLESSFQHFHVLPRIGLS